MRNCKGVAAREDATRQHLSRHGMHHDRKTTRNSQDILPMRYVDATLFLSIKTLRLRDISTLQCAHSHENGSLISLRRPQRAPDRRSVLLAVPKDVVPDRIIF